MSFLIAYTQASSPEYLPMLWIGFLITGITLTVIAVVFLVRWIRNGVVIQIINCSWGNPSKIGNETMRVVEVTFSLNTDRPKITVTGLQFYIEGAMQRLVDSNPSIPITTPPKNEGRCYKARFGVSYLHPGFMVSNEVKEYQLFVIAMGKRWASKKFSPQDFSRLLTPDKGGSQTE
ncbi:MAG: hypothetical protein JW790_03525 [Dehalococcoidales bacterium]|nr:hypothetical protein [Dehalococcoidales bacterium]